MMYTDASRFFVALHVLRLVQLHRGCRPLIAPVLLLSVSDPQQGGGRDYISRGEGGELSVSSRSVVIITFA